MQILWSSGTNGFKNTEIALLKYMMTVSAACGNISLLSAETMFRTGAQMVFQMQLSRIREATGLTRDYIFETEEKYRKQELGRELNEEPARECIFPQLFVI